jgi:hypothetical protein
MRDSDGAIESKTADETDYYPMRAARPGDNDNFVAALADVKERIPLVISSFDGTAPGTPPAGYTICRKGQVGPPAYTEGALYWSDGAGGLTILPTAVYRGMCFNSGVRVIGDSGWGFSAATLVVAMSDISPYSWAVAGMSAGPLIYQTQATWYIDPVAGNDMNNGLTEANAIQTMREWYARTLGISRCNMTVNLVGDLPSSDPLPGDVGPQGDFYIVFKGTLTSVESGTIASYTAADKVTYGLTRPAMLVAATDWTPHVGRLLKDTSIGANGAWMRIAKVLAAITDCYVTPCQTFASDFATGAAATPAMNDGYEVYTESKLYIACRGSQPKSGMTYSGSTMLGVYFVDLDLRPATGNDLEWASGINRTRLLRCRVAADNSAQFVNLRGGFQVSMTSVGHQSQVSSATFGGLGNMYSTLESALFLGTGNSSVYFRQGLPTASNGGILSIGCRLAVQNQTTLTSSADICVMNVAGTGANGIGVNVYQGAILDFPGAAVLYGSNNTAWGVQIESRGAVRAGGQLTPGSPPYTYVNLNITGATGQDVKIGGALVMMPDITASAGLVLPATAPCQTWAQCANAPFTGTVWNYGNGAYLGLS